MRKVLSEIVGCAIVLLASPAQAKQPYFEDGLSLRDRAKYVLLHDPEWKDLAVDQAWEISKIGIDKERWNEGYPTRPVDRKSGETLCRLVFAQQAPLGFSESTVLYYQKFRQLPPTLTAKAAIDLAFESVIATRGAIEVCPEKFSGLGPTRPAW